MKWQLKARVQNAIAALPFASNAVYYAIQRTVGGLRRNRNHPIDRFRFAIQTVEWIESTGMDIAGKAFIEIGTGHMVNVPTALWLLGAGKTVTVDLNRYLSQTLVAESNDYLRRNQEQVLALFGRHAARPDFQRRFADLTSFGGSLRELLDMMNVLYIAPCDARLLPVPRHSFDFHISNTVLEHIPRDDLIRLLGESKRVLNRNGLLVHRIDPSDHFSHDDDSISAVNFLKFPDKEWHRWAGNRFMYQNRLRVGDYISLFENAPSRILRLETQVNQRALDVLRNGFPVAEKFAGVPPDELAVTDFSIMARFASNGSHRAILNQPQPAE